jgi:oligopeptide transport system permease protein
MSAIPYQSSQVVAQPAPRPTPIWRQNVTLALRSPRILIGGAILLIIVLSCLGSLPFTLDDQRDIFYDGQFANTPRMAPSWESPAVWFGTDTKGRSILGRCLLGGVASLSVGFAAAIISVFLGVGVGLISGFRGGWLDAFLMRIVDVLYGLPYILLVILLKMALDRSPALTVGWWTDALLVTAGVVLALVTLFARGTEPDVKMLRADRKRFMTKATLLTIAAGLVAAGLLGLLPNKPLTMGQTNIVVLFLAIGLVSWLTMARVIRGQVLSLRSQPYVEAARALGIRESRIFLRHILPNLVGPITVYTTLTIPQAILQESFLSFLGLGVLPPTPSWGGLASDNRLAGLDMSNPQWWMLAFPCIMLALTLMSLNFLGDGLRDIVDPKREAAKL